MSNILTTQDGLIEKASGRKIISPLDFAINYAKAMEILLNSISVSLKIAPMKKLSVTEKISTGSLSTGKPLGKLPHHSPLVSSTPSKNKRHSKGRQK